MCALLCDQNESANHLFFTCSSSKVLRGVVLGTNSILISMWEYFVWFQATSLVEKNSSKLFSFLLFFGPF
jgi:hypothetical protein